jgi:D-alanine-D-alanine ligase
LTWFNLCEGLSGHARRAVELLGLPLTGARAFTLGLCLRKDLVNGHLRARGITVPDWALAEAGQPLAWRAFPAIVKPAAEDASLGIDDHSVAHDASELAAALERGHRTWDRLLVQRYVEGREFNLAVVGDQVLPPSEILWALPDGHPHIVSYAAKWETSSVDYRGTTPGWLGASEGRSLPGFVIVGHAGLGRRGRSDGRIDVGWTAAAVST